MLLYFIEKLVQELGYGFSSRPKHGEVWLTLITLMTGESPDFVTRREREYTHKTKQNKTDHWFYLTF